MLSKWRSNQPGMLSAWATGGPQLCLDAPGPSSAGAAVARDDALRRRLGEDPDPPGEVPLGPREDGVEHRELAPEGAPHVAVAAAQALTDVGVDGSDLEIRRIEPQLADALQVLAARRIERGVALGRDRQPLFDRRRARVQLREVDAGIPAPAIVPTLDYGFGRPEADGVVHDGRPPHTAPLEDREVEVARLLEHAVVVELADHADLVVAELGGGHVAPPLH